MKRGRLTALGGMIAAVALAVVASACGGGSISSSIDPVAAAATKSETAGAANARFVMALSSPQLGGKEIRVAGKGVVDGNESDLTVDMGSLFSQMGAPSGMPSSIREIALEEKGDQVLYLSFGGLPVFKGKSWARVDMTQAYEKLGAGPNSLASPGTIDPTQLLGLLKDVGTVKNLGPATVDGVSTTHYRAMIDVAKLLKKKDAGTQMQKLMSTVGLKTIPEDVWIGSDGLLHRLGLALAIHAKKTSLTMRMQMNLSDYGVKASIAAPPSGDVYDATSTFLSGGSGGLFGG